MSGTWEVEAVTPPATFDLRREVLRPHETAAEQALADDDDPDTLHVGVRLGATLVATGNIRRSSLPWSSPAEASDGVGDGPAWRIRGMATADDHRGRGLGAAVLASLLEHAARRGGGLVWCNARRGAATLYERAGFVVSGEEFELPEIGPHLLMWRRVPPR